MKKKKEEEERGYTKSRRGGHESLSIKIDVISLYLVVYLVFIFVFTFWEIGGEGGGGVWRGSYDIFGFVFLV